MSANKWLKMLLTFIYTQTHWYQCDLRGIHFLRLGRKGANHLS